MAAGSMSISTAVRPTNYAALFGAPALQSPASPTFNTAPADELLFDPSYFYDVNYHDTIDVSWTTWAPNSTSITLQLWYWQPSFGGSAESDPNDHAYKPFNSTAQIVPANGTQTFALNNIAEASEGYYLGKWVLDFDRSDVNPPEGTTYSGEFNCSFEDGVPARSWPQGKVQSTIAASAATVSLSTPTGTPSSSITPSATATAEAQTSASNSSITSGAIVGIVLAAILAVVAIACLSVFVLRQRRQKAENNAISDVAKQALNAEAESYLPIKTVLSVSEMPVNPADRPVGHHEMMGSSAIVPELAGHGAAAELDMTGRN